MKSGKFNIWFIQAVHVIALYGHAGLCYMTGVAEPIMMIRNGLVKSIMA